MKKKILYGIIFLIIGVMLGGGIYLIINNKDKANDEPKDNISDNINYETKEVEDNINSYLEELSYVISESNYMKNEDYFYSQKYRELFTYKYILLKVGNNVEINTFKEYYKKLFNMEYPENKIDHIKVDNNDNIIKEIKVNDIEFDNDIYKGYLSIIYNDDKNDKGIIKYKLIDNNIIFVSFSIETE